MIEQTQEKVVNDGSEDGNDFYYATREFLRENAIRNFKEDDFFSSDSYDDHMGNLIESVVEGPNYTSRVKGNVFWLVRSVDDFQGRELLLGKLRKLKVQEIDLGFNLFYFVDKIFFDSYYQYFCPDCSFCKERTIHPFVESAFAIQIAGDSKKKKDYLKAWEIIRNLSNECVCLDSPEGKSIVASLSLFSF